MPKEEIHKVLPVTPVVSVSNASHQTTNPPAQSSRGKRFTGSSQWPQLSVPLTQTTKQPVHWLSHPEGRDSQGVIDSNASNPTTNPPAQPSRGKIFTGSSQWSRLSVSLMQAAKPPNHQLCQSKDLQDPPSDSGCYCLLKATKQAIHQPSDLGHQRLWCKQASNSPAQSIKRLTGCKQASKQFTSPVNQETHKMQTSKQASKQFTSPVSQETHRKQVSNSPAQSMSILTGSSQCPRLSMSLMQAV